jgi:hypothetical protein
MCVCVCAVCRIFRGNTSATICPYVLNRSPIRFTTAKLWSFVGIVLSPFLFAQTAAVSQSHTFSMSCSLYLLCLHTPGPTRTRSHSRSAADAPFWSLAVFGAEGAEKHSFAATPLAHTLFKFLDMGACLCAAVCGCCRIIFSTLQQLSCVSFFFSPTQTKSIVFERMQRHVFASV